MVSPDEYARIERDLIALVGTIRHPTVRAAYASDMRRRLRELRIAMERAPRAHPAPDLLTRAG